jgi:outer membrane immunogenic protein
MKRLLFGAITSAALVAGPAVAADIPVKARLYRAPPAVVYGWTGFYVGGNAGYSWGRAGSDWNIYAPGAGGSFACTPAGGALCVSGSGSNNLRGVIGGVQAGYNWQTGGSVFGIETDIQASGEKGRQTYNVLFPTNLPAQPFGTVSESQTEKLPWFGTLRARAGVAADRWLIYATGGLAYGQVKVSGSATITQLNTVVVCGGLAICPLSSWSNNATRAGWTIGAGLESVISDRWTWKVEYLHVDLGKVDATFATVASCGGGPGGCVLFAAGTGTMRSRTTDEVVRVGLNYKLGYPPVVTRY